MDFIQPVIAILAVLALLSGVLIALRKRGAVSFRAPSKHLEMIERIPLGPQHALHLVRSGDRTLLIATSPNSCQMLATPDLKDLS